jgi:hypothetical protein
MDWYRLVFMRVLIIDSFSRTSVTKPPLGTKLGTVGATQTGVYHDGHLCLDRSPSRCGARSTS